VIDPVQQDAGTVETGSQGEEEIEKPEMSLQTTIILLIIVTVV
jgi:hypothetical protein